MSWSIARAARAVAGQQAATRRLLSMADCFGLILFLVIAGVIGWVADLIVPGKMPYGWIGGIIAALIGGIVAGMLPCSQFGPGLNIVGGYTYFIIPGLLGPILVAFVARLSMGQMNRRAL